LLSSRHGPCIRIAEVDGVVIINLEEIAAVILGERVFIGYP
jgi:hypothetical protein